MTNPPPLDPTLTARYLAHECSAAERAEVEQVLRAYPEAAAFLRAFRQAGHTTMPGELRDANRGWSVVQRQMALRNTSHKPVPDANVAVAHKARGNFLHGDLLLHPLRNTMRYAAITLVLTVLGVVIGWRGGKHRVREQGERSVTTYTTPNGERANITLLDGTTVALNVGSRLDVPADFAATHLVHLTGEALFTVSHHDAVPFAVRAGAMTARVLGTGFVVRHYPTDTVTMVAVQDGKVAVESTVITAHRLLEVGKSGDMRLRAADPSRFTFATGVLTLDPMPLRDAIPELNRWYDADIRVSDSRLLQQKIRGTVSTASLSELAEMLEWTLNARVVREGRVLTLYRTGK